MAVQARIQTKEHKNKSIHWTHQFAEVGRAQNPMLDSTKPQKPVGDIQLIELLPSKEVQARFQKTWAVLISRVICKYLASFHQYRSLVIHHIPHQFSEEMSQKSKSVSGYKFFDRNIVTEQQFSKAMSLLSLNWGFHSFFTLPPDWDAFVIDFTVIP